jgi:hypothetical protein
MHVRPTSAVLTRVRRFLLFIVLGYALHFPVERMADLASAGEERWRSFLAVDVLQLIGVTFVAVQLLVVATRSRRLFTAAAFLLAFVVVLATPAVWSMEWSAVSPPVFAAYMSPAAGSLFPVFPWAAFILIGAGLGQVYARWGAAHLTAYAAGVLLVPGLALLAAVFAARALEWPLFGDPAGAVPSEVAVRVGVCLVALSGIAFAGRRINRLPHIFGAVAQESLLIYFVHLCIVYGSIWNRGLAQIQGETLDPWTTLAWVMTLLASMAALAWYWNWWKHTRPRAARWMSVAAGALLVYDLI